MVQVDYNPTWMMELAAFGPKLVEAHYASMEKNNVVETKKQSRWSN